MEPILHRFGKEYMMSRIAFICVAGLVIVSMLGCEKAVKDDPRYRINPAEMAQAAATGYHMPDATEVDLVEALASSRQEYYAHLQSLQRFYAARGYSVKKAWADKELASVGQIPQYRYLTPAETALADRRATDSIEEADILFNEAISLYQDAGALLIFTDEEKLRMALNKFNELIETYPSSDKIDDSAYRAGRIYEHFKDYEIAAAYYQRAFQWNEVTPYPARFRAALLMDQKLHDRAAALALYRLAVEYESRYQENTEYAKERILALSKAQGEPIETPGESG
jgi:tetratricopeptide (TPR) repeat protein